MNHSTIRRAYNPTQPDYVQAIYRYCTRIDWRFPIFSLRVAPGSDYICDLTLPSNAPCPALRTKQPTRELAISVAARCACELLIRQGELSKTLVPLKAPPKSRPCPAFGNLMLSAAKQDELGLSSIPISLLHVVLKPFINNFPSSSFPGLGEAFIKFFICTYFFSRFQNEFERMLTKRSQREARLVVLSSYVLSSCLARYVRTETGNERYSDRTAAGVFRGVIGAAVSSCGIDQGIQILRELGMNLDAKVKSMSSIRDIYQFYRPLSISYSPIMQPAHHTLRIWKVESALGYTFSDPRLLLQAVNHKSSMILPSYERLEFLGDAVMEFVVANHYHRKFHFASLGKFRVFKHIVLSNDAFGTLFASLGLEDVLITGYQSLEIHLKRDAMRSVQAMLRGRGWRGMRLNKILSDAMEALIGAVFIDCGFSLGPVEDVLSRTLFPFIDGSGVDSIFSRKRNNIAPHYHTSCKRRRIC